MKKMDFVKDNEDRTSRAKYKSIGVTYYPDSPVKCSCYQCGFDAYVNNYGYGRSPEKSVRDFRRLLIRTLDEVNELLEEKESDDRSDT